MALGEDDFGGGSGGGGGGGGSGAYRTMPNSSGSSTSGEGAVIDERTRVDPIALSSRVRRAGSEADSMAWMLRSNAGGPTITHSLSHTGPWAHAVIVCARVCADGVVIVR